MVVEEARRSTSRSPRTPAASRACAAVEAGVSTLEHCSFVTETNERLFSEDLAARIAERRIYVCPTISMNAPYVAKLTGIVVGPHLTTTSGLGVRLVVGTDAGIDYTPTTGTWAGWSTW